jgi:HK97 family phage major capsid protein
MRGLATVITTSSGSMETPIVADHGTAEWTDEMADYHESDVVFDQIILGAHKATSIIKVSEELLYDNAFDLEAFLVRAYGRRFGLVEEDAFVDGDGTKKPTGIFSMAEVGVNGSDTTSFTADEVIDLYHSLRRPYRPMATWMMNDTTVKMIRKMKDLQGNYLWQPGLQASEPDRILGRPVAVAETAPGLVPLGKPILFGDISYYWIADRQGRVFQRLNELYAAQGMIGFKAYQRVDGKLTLSETCKTLELPNTVRRAKTAK